MPAAIIEALIALKIPPQTPVLDLPSCSRNMLRILAVETISTAESIPPESDSVLQGISFSALLILLLAATLRKRSRPSTAVTMQQENLNSQEKEKDEDHRELEEQLRQISVEGSHRLNTKFIWIVAQKTIFPIDKA